MGLTIDQIEQLPKERQRLAIENSIFAYTLHHYGIRVKYDTVKYPDYYTQEFIDKVTERGKYYEIDCGYTANWTAMKLIMEFFEKEDAPVFFHTVEI